MIQVLKPFCFGSNFELIFQTQILTRTAPGCTGAHQSVLGAVLGVTKVKSRNTAKILWAVWILFSCFGICVDIVNHVVLICAGVFSIFISTASFGCKVSYRAHLWNQQKPYNCECVFVKILGHQKSYHFCCILQFSFSYPFLLCFCHFNLLHLESSALLPLLNPQNLLTFFISFYFFVM